MRKLIAVGAMMLIDTIEKAALAVGSFKSAPYDAAFRLQQVKNPGGLAIDSVRGLRP